MADCALCGGRWINGYMGCSRTNCNEYRLVTECNEWPVSLGLSIRRFVRRAEVAALAEEVSNASRMLAWVALNDPTEDLTRIDTALSRLAALAMEGVE